MASEPSAEAMAEALRVFRQARSCEFWEGEIRALALSLDAAAARGEARGRAEERAAIVAGLEADAEDGVRLGFHSDARRLEVIAAWLRTGHYAHTPERGDGEGG